MTNKKLQFQSLGTTYVSQRDGATMENHVLVWPDAMKFVSFANGVLQNWCAEQVQSKLTLPDTFVSFNIEMPAVWTDDADCLKSLREKLVQRYDLAVTSTHVPERAKLVPMWSQVMHPYAEARDETPVLAMKLAYAEMWLFGFSTGSKQ